MHRRLYFLLCLQAFHLSHANICDETLIEDRGADYRGCQHHTLGGLPCQAWTSQDPHSHSMTPENYPVAGLVDGEGTYCRNPDGEPSIWCYTMDPGTRWDFCEPLAIHTVDCPVYSCGEDVTVSSDECLLQFAALACPMLEGSLMLTQVTSLKELAELSIVKGNLVIVASPALTSLTGLERLSEVTGELAVESNPSLMDMKGLDNLRSVGSLKIFRCEALEVLTGLDKLASVASYLWIEDCRALRHLTSLTSLVGEQSFSLTLTKCNRLTSLQGLEGITSLGVDRGGASLRLKELPLLRHLLGLENLRGSLPGGLFIQSNPMLKDVSELHGITAVGKSNSGSSIGIEVNTQLHSIRGLSNIMGDLPGSLSLDSCQALESLDGLQGITSIGADETGTSLVLRNLGISSVTELTNLTGNLSGSIEIASNSQLQSLEGLHHITKVGQDVMGTSLFLLGNENLRSIVGLRGLQGNLPGGLTLKSMRSLTSLNGLEGITSLGRVKEDSSARISSFGDCSGYSICLVDMQSLVTLGALSSISGALPGALKVNRCHALKSLIGLGSITSLTAHANETSYAIWIEENSQLESIAALGTLEGVLKVVQTDVQDAGILVHSCPALKSLQGIEKIFDYFSSFFQISLPEGACYDPSERLLFTQWNQESCKDCQPQCGVDVHGRSIECDYAIGACRCPLGWSGPGCVHEVSQVEIMPGQHVTCNGPLPGSQQHTRCPVSVRLTRQLLPTGNVSAAKSLMPYMMDTFPNSVTLESTSIRIVWLSETEGRISFDLLIESEHTVWGSIAVGYPTARELDCILTGTVTETKASTGLRSHPWPACLDDGTCLKYSKTNSISFNVKPPHVSDKFCTKGRACVLNYSRDWGSFFNVSLDLQGSIVMAVQSSGCLPVPEMKAFLNPTEGSFNDSLEVELGRFHNKNPGLYNLCLSSIADRMTTTFIGPMFLFGPGTGFFACRLGRPCELILQYTQGPLEEQEDTLGIFESCPAGEADGERAVEGLTFAGFGGLALKDRGRFLFSQQASEHSLSGGPRAVTEPGMFMLCWCRPEEDDDCRKSKYSYTPAGYITVQGPYSRQRFTCQLNTDCNVTLRGVGLEGGHLVMAKSCGSQTTVSMTPVLNSLNDEGIDFIVPARDLGTFGPQEASLCWCNEAHSCVHAEEFSAEAAIITWQCPQDYFYSSGSSLCLPCPPGGKCTGGDKPDLTCEAGWYLDLERCILCDGPFAPIRAADDGSRCTIDAARTAGLLVTSICILSAVMLLPIMLGLNIPIEDVGKDHRGVVVKANIQHCLRSSRHRWEHRAFASFFDTGIPWLNAPAKYAVKPLNAYELLLLDAAGEPLRTDMDGSIGYLRLTSHSALRLTAVLLPLWLGVPALVILCLAAYVLLSVPLLSVTWQLPLAVVISAALHVSRQRRARYTPLRKKLLLFEKRLKEGSAKPIPVPPGPGRALKASAVLDLHQHFETIIGSRSMYYVCPNLVLPLTQEFRLSYSEVAGPTEVEWFCSHYWGHPFLKTVDSIKKHAEKLAELQTTFADAREKAAEVCEKSWADAAYWICTFSNNQYELEKEIPPDAPDPTSSSFYKALWSKTCKGTCMVIEESVAPLSRSWCLFELLQTFVRDKKRDAGRQDAETFQGLTFITSSGVLNLGGCSSDLALQIGRRLAVLKLQDADASNKIDKVMIAKQVETEFGSFDNVDFKLKEELRSVLDMTLRRFQDDIHNLEKQLGWEAQESVSVATL